MMVGWGRVCAIFFGCLDVGRGYVLAIGVHFERSPCGVFDVVFLGFLFLGFWCLFCVYFIFVVLEVEGWYPCRLVVFDSWYLMSASFVVKEMCFRMGRMISCRVGMGCEFTWYLGICFVVLSVLVMLVGFGKVCVIFLNCLDVRGGYELVIGVFVVIA